MQSIIKVIKLAGLSLASAALISCGGGGGGSTTTSNTSSTTTGAISGTAAVGAPILGGNVNIYDSTGTQVGSTTTSLTDGSYSVPSLTGKAPFTVEVIGNVGDSQGKYYAVVGSTGVANVNQISNGIAASLSSTGDPSALIAGHSQTAANISTKETGFVGALNSVLTAMGVSSSPVTGAFSASLDSALDHVDVVLLPDGSYEIASSEGQAVPDIMGSFNPDTTQAANHKVKSYAKGEAPSSSDTSNIPAPSSTVVANAATLETLRAQLEACFSHLAASRATFSSAGSGGPNWGTTIHADCQGLAYDDGAGSAFKHDSYYWIENVSSNSMSPTSGCINTNGYCLGLFGAMLNNSNYDKLTFLKPDHIRPAGTNLWHVKFPVVYSTGTRGQFGDVVGTAYNIVRYDTATKKFQFYGNQRDVQSTIQPAVSLIEKNATGNYRLETGLNIYVSPYSSRSLKNKRCTGGAASCAVYPISARVTPVNSSTGLLPAGGVMFANKVNTTPTITQGVGSSKSTPFNVCTYMNLEDPTLINANYSVAATATAAACSGVIRLNYAEFTKDSKGALVAAPGVYPPPRARPSWISSWNSNGSYNGNDSSPLVTATTTRGEQYKFVVTMSNGDVIKFINRLPNSTLTPTQASKLTFPSLASGVDASFASFAGSSSGFNLSWNPMQSALIFAAAIYWEQGDIDNTVGVAPADTSKTIPCPNNAGNSALSGLNYANTAVADLLNCTLPLNWKSTNTTSNPDGGVLQLKARTFDGLYIQSQVKQF